jgi:hypothetical protein
MTRRLRPPALSSGEIPEADFVSIGIFQESQGARAFVLGGTRGYPFGVEFLK